MSCIVFDLDGTLACGKHRLHLLPKEENRNRTESWDAFNLAAGDDTPLWDNIALTKALWPTFKIVILTGRCAVAQELTIDWLRRHHVAYDALIMRPKEDHRKDVEFKEEKLAEIEAKYGKITCCFDDMRHMVKFIRSLGYTCHEVTHYEAKEQNLANTEPKEKAA